MDSETGQMEIRAMKAEIHRMKVGGRREVGGLELGVLGRNHSGAAAYTPSTPRKLAVPPADFLHQCLSSSCSYCTRMVTGHDDLHSIHEALLPSLQAACSIQYF